MNGRIFVLLAVTGLFVHVWEANHKSQPEQIAAVEVVARSNPIDSATVELSLDLPEPTETPTQRRENIPVRKITAEAEKTATEDIRFEQRFEAVVQSKVSPSVSSLWIEPAVLPDRLPQGIAIGLYQVVDNFGHATLVQITSERLAQAGIVTESKVRDLYIHQSGNQRWYFIRQGDIGESYPTVTPTQSAPATLTDLAPATPPVVSATDVMPAPQKVVAENSKTSRLTLLTIMQNRIMNRQRERMVEQITAKLATMGITWLLVVPEPAQNLSATGMTKVAKTLSGMGEAILQNLQATGLLPEGTESSSPRQEVQELPSVAVPGSEVELPAIPLRTVKQTNPEVVPPL